MPRDNFTRVTIDIMAKRVAYLCSNPGCRIPTIGSNTDSFKATITGVAAHITAAAPGGPRFDPSLSDDERSSIENGIWLCSNCATLIDKDADRFPVSMLKKWKEEAEAESISKIMSNNLMTSPAKIPYLEADLIWTHGGRWNEGYSAKNPIEEEEDGRRIMVIRQDRPPIIFWRLNWNFKIAIYNNADVPAFNVKVTQLSEFGFTEMSKLSRVNNLPPYKNLDLEARYETVIEGTYLEADEQLKYKIKLNLVVLQIKFTYKYQKTSDHNTIVTVKNNELINKKSD